MKNNKTILLLLVLAGLTACVKSDRQEATGDGTVRSLNASVTTPEITFLLQERPIGVTGYKAISAATRFDDLDYDANFDYRFAGATSITRLLSIPFKLDTDMDHLFIFTGTLAQPETLLWQRPSRVWTGTETVMQVEFGHLSPKLGEVDVYLDAPGTLPVSGAARATLTNGNHSAALELTAGSYELVLTPVGNPGNILFTSTAFDFRAATSYLVAVFDGDPALTSAISVRALLESGSSVEMVNKDVPPTLRSFHAAFSLGAFDLYRGGDFSAPLIANLANNELSAAVDVATDESTYTFTAVGNPGAILHEEDFFVIDGRRTTRILLGRAPELATVVLVDDFRSLEDSARFRILHASNDQRTVDLYFVKAGEVIADSSPRFFSLTYKFNTGYANFAADSYQLYATTPGTKDVLAGPFALNLVDGDVVHFILVDTVDPNVIEFIKYDHRNIAIP